MKRILIFAYGITAYLLFLVVFTYLAGVLLSILVPKGFNSVTGTEASLFASVVFNLLLVGIF